MEPLRVTHFAHSDAGSGASANALRLHRSLSRLGIESRLWVAQRLSHAPGVMLLRDRGFVRRRLRELEPWLEAQLLGRLLPGREPPLSSGVLGHDPLPVVESDRPDVVQLHWLGCATLRLARLPALRRPIVWRIADLWPIFGAEHLCEDPARFLADAADGTGSAVDDLIARGKQAIYAQLDDLTIVCPSRWTADLVRRSRLLAGRPVERIPTGCDTELFRPLDRSTCRDILGLPRDGKLVLAGATNLAAPHKGLDLLVEAARRVQPDPSGVSFVLFGPNGGEVARALPGKVMDRGSIADPLHIALLYSACDVFVAPSRIENLSNAVLEALACGTPCVAFDIGGMPDAIAHRETGYLARAFETDDLAAGIDWALRVSDTAALRARCRARIETEFSVTAQAEAFAALYRRVVSDARSSARP